MEVDTEIRGNAMTFLQALLARFRRQKRRPGRLTLDDAISMGVQSYTRTPDGDYTIRPLARDDQEMWDEVTSS